MRAEMTQQQYTEADDNGGGRVDRWDHQGAFALITGGRWGSRRAATPWHPSGGNIGTEQ